MNSATQLGRLLGNLANNQNTLAQNISADESDPLLTLFANDEIIVEGILSVNTKLYATDSFIIDHPVYGIIDSSILKIDGGYASTSLQGTYLI